MCYLLQSLCIDDPSNPGNFAKSVRFYNRSSVRVLTEITISVDAFVILRRLGKLTRPSTLNLSDQPHSNSRCKGLLSRVLLFGILNDP